MARGRFISNEIIKDRETNELSSDTCRLAYVYLITISDCEGRIVGEPDFLASLLFPRRREITPKMIEGFIQEWIDAGFVFLYENGNGDRVLQLINFEKHQKGLRKDRETATEFDDPENCKILKKKDNLIINDNVNVNGNSGNNPDKLPTNSGVSHSQEQGEKLQPIHDNTQILFQIDDSLPFADQILQAYNLKKGAKRKPYAAFDAMCVMFQDVGVTIRDYLESIDELEADGRYGNATSPTSAEKWAINKAKKRNKGKPTKSSNSADDFKESWGK